MWNYLGLYSHYDHFDVIGWLQSPGAVFPLYENIENIVFGL